MNPRSIYKDNAVNSPSMNINNLQNLLIRTNEEFCIVRTCLERIKSLLSFKDAISEADGTGVDKSKIKHHKLIWVAKEYVIAELDLTKFWKVPNTEEGLKIFLYLLKLFMIFFVERTLLA